MNATVYTLLAVLICAVITFLLRFAPFALFGGKREMPPAVRRLAGMMPAAIIAVLVVYCLKGMPEAGAGQNAVTLFSVFALAALQLWKKNTLLSIAGGTALYMILLRMI